MAHQLLNHSYKKSGPQDIFNSLSRQETLAVQTSAEGKKSFQSTPQLKYHRRVFDGFLENFGCEYSMIEAEKKHWLVRPETVRLLWRISLTVLALMVLLDFFVHGHPSFQIDGTFGFYAWFGLVTCVGMVLFAKALGIFLKRKDTYYDDE